MVVFLLFNLIVPVVKPKKVDAAGFALGYLIAAAVYGNAIVAGIVAGSNIVLASTDVEGLSEDFWAKASEDGKVSEYQAQLLNYGNQLVYDSVKDAYISGSPHVSGCLLQTLADVIADYYYKDIDTSGKSLLATNLENRYIAKIDGNNVLIVETISGQTPKFVVRNKLVANSDLPDVSISL